MPRGRWYSSGIITGPISTFGNEYWRFLWTGGNVYGYDSFLLAAVSYADGGIWVAREIREPSCSVAWVQLPIRRRGDFVTGARLKTLRATAARGGPDSKGSRAPFNPNAHILLAGL